MGVGARQDNDHGNKGRGNESNIDLNVGEHDEPSVSMPFLELSGTFGACDTASWVFSTAIGSAERNVISR